MNKLINISVTAALLTFVNLPIAAKPAPAIPSPTPSQSPAGIVAPTGESVVAQYECRSRGPSTGQIILRANNKYDVKQQTGKYQQSQVGYRFLTGPLKGQSIVRKKGNTYLVSTRNEARADRLAAVDAALFCTGGVIYY
jgi:hypothetical protein